MLGDALISAFLFSLGQFPAPGSMMLVKDLLAEIPPDTIEVVARACEFWNLKVRRQLTDQFLRWGLQYRRGGHNFNATLSTDWDRVGKEVRNALPDSLADRHIPPEFERAARLSVYAPSARRMADASEQLLRLFGRERQAMWHDTQVSPGMARGTLEGAGALSHEILRLAAPAIAGGGHFDLVRFLLEIDEDVLGSYRFDVREVGAVPNPGGEVTVYWGTVGLVASSLGVNPGALAVVVLAHEFAHGYSHLGHDRDGRRWSGHDFAKSDHVLKEAIAQYYTHLIAVQLDGVLPGVYEAYACLVPKQPPAYHAHLPWLLHRTPERVASALAGVRERPASWPQVCDALGLKPEQWHVPVDAALGELARRRDEVGGVG